MLNWPTPTMTCWAWSIHHLASLHVYIDKCLWHEFVAYSKRIVQLSTQISAIAVNCQFNHGNARLYPRYLQCKIKQKFQELSIANQKRDNFFVFFFTFGTNNTEYYEAAKSFFPSLYFSATKQRKTVFCINRKAGKIELCIKSKILKWVYWKWIEQKKSTKKCKLKANS